MRESKSEKAYREIRRGIIRLDLEPGALINEGELIERLGIGRTPVREAVQRLTREQLVAVIPRRGLMVTPINPEQLPMLYETRALLEPFAARLAAQRGTDLQWDEMGAVLDGARIAADDADLLEVDRLCHELTWTAARNDYLTDTLDMLYAQSERVWHYYLSDVDDMRGAMHEHVEIYEALRAGDGDSAAALSEAHVRAFDKQIRKALDRRQPN